MKILVLNGSPKGEYSITLQTCLFIMRHFRDHSFSVIHVGAQIKSLEKDFSKAKKMLEEADLILFSYPVYTFLVPAQLHRFIELMKEMQVNVKGKYAAQISTSKHFYDVTAHQFIMDNCKDLGLEYLEGLSADMDDLKSKKGQADALRSTASWRTVQKRQNWSTSMIFRLKADVSAASTVHPQERVSIRTDFRICFATRSRRAKQLSWLLPLKIILWDISSNYMMIGSSAMDIGRLRWECRLATWSAESFRQNEIFSF